MSCEDICRMLDSKTRDAVARSIYGYYDGKELKLFESELNGTIAKTPAGNNGFGWDQIFIPDGYNITNAELSEEDYYKVYVKIKPLKKVRQFLEQR